jgi:hypothetical protein
MSEVPPARSSSGKTALIVLGTVAGVLIVGALIFASLASLWKIIPAPGGTPTPAGGASDRDAARPGSTEGRAVAERFLDDLLAGDKDAAYRHATEAFRSRKVLESYASHFFTPPPKYSACVVNVLERTPKQDRVVLRGALSDPEDNRVPFVRNRSAKPAVARVRERSAPARPSSGVILARTSNCPTTVSNLARPWTRGEGPAAA